VVAVPGEQFGQEVFVNRHPTGTKGLNLSLIVIDTDDTVADLCETHGRY
jgi:hypothetical protein